MNAQLIFTNNGPVADPIPSSSPAFGTPVHPVRNGKPNPGPVKVSILPILLPPATLRPVAFRTFTKKHNLTLISTALQSLATFIGKNCGSGWREEGLAERVLDEVAKTWKKNGGGVIVEEGNGNALKAILQNLEGSMSGGKVVQANASNENGHHISLARTNSLDSRPHGPSREDSLTSLGMSTFDVSDEEEEGRARKDARSWMKVIGAFEQRRLVYNVGKKQFETSTSAPSLFPHPSHKTHLFRARYNLVHQRLLRNESFQTPSFAVPLVATLQRSSSTVSTAQQAYKLTPVANLLGRSGTSHLLLGLLAIAPTGELSIADLSGSIALDIQHARPVPEDGAWFAPGMIVLVDGIYEEEGNSSGSGGVGGTIGGRFVGISIGGPPCERREVTLGTGHGKGKSDVTAGGGFGWVDFLGIGSERAQGPRMRRIEQRLTGLGQVGLESSGRSRIIVMTEPHLDVPRTFEALRKVFGIYAAQPTEGVPLVIIMTGNFVQHAVMSEGGSGGSIEYKEYFDRLASVLSDYPSVLQMTTFVFVPGDNDPWASAFSAGAATTIPREGVPELFTSRVRRAFANANFEAELATGRKGDGEAVWTSNPSRLSLFGPVRELVIFRDDISGRLRRGALTFKPLEKEESEQMSKTDVEMDGQEAEGMTEGNAIPENGERMDVDSAVEAAESHVPAVKGRSQDGDSSSAEVLAARKLVKTIVDQGHLSPFPLSTRPVLWDYASSLHLYPLPTALVLADAEAPPFTVTYEGCHVMNPGKLVAEDCRGLARWVEYDLRTRRGKVREERF